jgi:hypothetical protein
VNRAKDVLSFIDLSGENTPDAAVTEPLSKQPPFPVFLLSCSTFIPIFVLLFF